MPSPRVGRDQVLAFRASAHGLDRRRPPGGLVAVVGACGVQDTPPGNADVALAARLDLSGPEAAAAVAARRVVLTWSLRGAPHLVPPEDHGVFTLGARPTDATSLEAVAGGTGAALAAAGVDLWDAFVRIEEAMVDALGDEVLTKAELSAAVTAAVELELAPWCRACKVHHPPEGLFRAAPLAGRIVLTGTAPVTLARTAAWLGREPGGDVDELRRELLVRYLRCYGPSTAAHFAAWAGIGPADARRRWRLVEPALARIEVEGRKAAVLEEDVERLLKPSPVAGVRLLPAKDALLQARDRDLLVPDPATRKAVFAVLGGPGVVLVEGEVAGIWRGAARGRRYQVRVRAFRSRPADALEDEAQRVTVARGHEGAEVVAWE